MGTGRSGPRYLEAPTYPQFLRVHLLLVQAGLLEGLEEEHVQSIYDDIINAIDIDPSAYVQTTRLGQQYVVITAVAVVVIGVLTRVPLWVDEDERVPLVMSQSRSLTWVEVGEHGEHNMRASQAVRTPALEALLQNGWDVGPMRTIADGRQMIGISGLERAHDLVKC